MPIALYLLLSSFSHLLGLSFPLFPSFYLYVSLSLSYLCVCAPPCMDLSLYKSTAIATLSLSLDLILQLSFELGDGSSSSEASSSMTRLTSSIENGWAIQSLSTSDGRRVAAPAASPPWKLAVGLAPWKLGLGRRLRRRMASKKVRASSLYPSLFLSINMHYLSLTVSISFLISSLSQ